MEYGAGSLHDLRC